MAEATTVAILLQAKDNASQALDKVRDKSKGLAESFAKHRQQIGIAAAGIGASITGMALIAVNSAEEQRKTIRGLDTALKNIGSSYEANKKQIEDLAAAQQKKTNFGDEESRQALTKLITVSGDYNLSIKGLTVAQDIAAGSGKALDSVVEALGKALAGEASAMKAFLPPIEATASAEDVLAEATRLYGGQAEAAFDATEQLNQTISDLNDAIGTALLPMMDKTLGKLDGVVRKIVDFTEKNPDLVNTLVPLATALGVALTALGGLILIAPGIHAMILLLTMQFGGLSLAMGPITAIVMGITAVVMAGILVYKNWDKIMAMITITMKKTKEGIVALGKGLVEGVISMMEIIRVMSDFIPGMDGVSDAMERGIGKLTSIQDAMDDWAAGSEQAISEVSQESEDMAVRMGIDQENVQKVLSDSTVAHEAHANAVATASKNAARAVTESKEEMSEAARMNLEIDNFISRQLIENMEDEMGVRRSVSEETKRLWKEQEDERLKIIQESEEKRLASAADTAARQIEIDNYLSRALIENEMEVNAVSVELSKERRQLQQIAIEDQRKASEAAAAELLKQQEELAAAMQKSLDSMMQFQPQNVAIPNVEQGGRVGGHGPREQSRKGIDMFDIEAKFGEDFRFDDWLEKEMPGILEPFKATTGSGTEISHSAHITSGAISNAAKNAMNRGEDPFEAIIAHAEANITRHQEQIQKMASGGISRGGLSLVGERGPEIVSLPAGSRVHPNGTGPGSNTFIFNGAVYGVEQLKEVIVEAVRDHAISGGFAGVFQEA